MSISEKEKYEALEKWHLEEHLHLPRTGSDATEGFDAGWEACEKLMTDKASEGFEEFWGDGKFLTTASSWSRDYVAEKIWVAAKFSAFRDVNFTNEQYLALEERLKEAEGLIKKSLSFNFHYTDCSIDEEENNCDCGSDEFEKVANMFLAKHKGDKGKV